MGILDIQLVEAAEKGDLTGVKAALDAGGDVNATVYGYYALEKAAGSTSPCALDVVKLLMERGANPHEKNVNGYTAFTESLRCGNTAIADYLFSCDDFLLSDLMPRPRYLQADIYKEHRAKAIARVSELVDAKGISFAKMVAADIEKILNTEKPKPTKEDIKALGIIAKKIATKDWVADAQVSSDAFLDSDIER